MKMRIGNLLGCTAFAAMLGMMPASSFANVITFGNTAVDRLDLAGLQVEDGFMYLATADGWELQTDISNPGAALVTFYNGEGSDIGDAVTFGRVGGGTFTFDSLEWRTILDSDGADEVEVIGLLGGSVVSSFSLSGESTTFMSVAGFGSTVIDTLRLLVTQSGSHAMVFDNIRFTPGAVATPAPGPLALLMLGGMAFGLRRRFVAR